MQEKGTNHKISITKVEKSLLLIAALKVYRDILPLKTIIFLEFLTNFLDSSNQTRRRCQGGGDIFLREKLNVSGDFETPHANTLFPTYKSKFMVPSVIRKEKQSKVKFSVREFYGNSGMDELAKVSK